MCLCAAVAQAGLRSKASPAEEKLMDNLAASVLNRLETVKDAGLAGTCGETTAKQRAYRHAHTHPRVATRGGEPGGGQWGRGTHGVPERRAGSAASTVWGAPVRGPPRDL